MQGNIAAMNVKGYLLDPRCDVVAVCDSDEVVGRQAAADWGSSYYSDMDEMLAESLTRRQLKCSHRPTCTTTT